MNKTIKLLRNTLRVILILFTLYLGFAGLRTYRYNHVYTIEQKLDYIRSYYMNTGFPRTNEQLLKSEIFKENDIKYAPAKPLDPNAMGIAFKTKHFDVACIGGGIVLVNGHYYYKNNSLYDRYDDSGKKFDDKKGTQMVNKELKEFTDKFGKHMGLQIYNPF